MHQQTSSVRRRTTTTRREPPQRPMGAGKWKGIRGGADSLAMMGAYTQKCKGKTAESRGPGRRAATLQGCLLVRGDYGSLVCLAPQPEQNQSPVRAPKEGVRTTVRP